MAPKNSSFLQPLLRETSLFAIFCFVLPFAVLASAPADKDSQLPVFFVENRGQMDPRIRYMMKRPEMALYFLEGEIQIAISGKSISLRLIGANLQSPIEGRTPMPGFANFFVGNDSAKWRTDIPLQGAIAYRNNWPGIDMIYSTTGRKLKSEFVVAPGVNPAPIRWTYGPEASARVREDGSLSIQVGSDEFLEDAPEIYQETSGKREPVKGSFHVFVDGSVGFELGSYDHTRTLVIDPVMTYSTFVGGSGQDIAMAVASDPSGNPVLVGWTSSADLPAKGVKIANAGGVDAFVAKMTAYGNDVVYCTYLGGSGDDRAFGVAVDRSGNAYVTGWTGSVNFPVIGPLQPKFGGGRDAFVAKLNPTGNALLYSTYLGGTAYDAGSAIAVDGSGNAYVTGSTSSANFPLASAFQTVRGGQQDAFVSKVNPAGNALVYSTYLGGANEDHGSGIAVDAAGNAYVTGGTFSNNFPVASAFQAVSGGNQDAFVTKFAPSGKTLGYSTYLGGSAGTSGLPEMGNGIAVDALGSAYIAGVTSSTNFPTTTGAFQTANSGGNTDGFVAKLNPAGTGLVYSTYLGGSSVDAAHAIALDLAGNAYVVGQTASSDFPTMRPFQAGNHGTFNAFLTKLNGSGAALHPQHLPGRRRFGFGKRSCRGLFRQRLSRGSYYFLRFSRSAVQPGIFECLHYENCIRLAPGGSDQRRLGGRFPS